MRKGFTLWFTGLSGSGKTTLGTRVAGIIREREMPVELLDEEEVRDRFWRGLEETREDREEATRRLGYFCSMLSRNGVVAVPTTVSPFKEVREEVRASHERFVEVYCECPLEVLEDRDVKGLYGKARAGEIANFAGVSSPYEPPARPEILVNSAKETVEQSVDKIIRTLELMDYIPPAGTESYYSDEEEQKIISRLRDLGYI